MDTVNYTIITCGWVLEDSTLDTSGREDRIAEVTQKWKRNMHIFADSDIKLETLALKKVQEENRELCAMDIFLLALPLCPHCSNVIKTSPLNFLEEYMEKKCGYLASRLSV